MSFFNSNKKDYTVIIGCERLGSKLANTLSDEDRDVLIVDECKDSFRRLSANFGGLTISGDGMDITVLKEAKIDKSDALIVVTDDENVNIMIAQIAKKLFNCKKVTVRLYDIEKKVLCDDMGIETLCPVMLSVENIKSLMQ
ncbi:NAD-binding protein [Erysipelotrichaceae bacterium HCN-30851]